MHINIRKIFAYILTHRRHYIVLSSIFFLMQDGATEQLVGISMAIGSIAGFVMETPSGYFADTFGHKKTLILGKVAMLLATLCYVFADGYMLLILASIFISLGFALSSGTIQAFTHETLESLDKDDEYAGTMSKIKGWSSLIQVFTFSILPMLAEGNILIAFYIGIVIDVIGLGISLTLQEPNVHKNMTKKKPFVQIFKSLYSTKFWYIALFFGLIGAFVQGFSVFREPYLQFQNMPLAFIGYVAAGSRLMRWVFSYGINRIYKKYSLSSIMRFEIVFFTLYFILAGFIPNIYIVGCMLAIGLGYRHARTPIINKYIINGLPDKQYKSTVLSLKSQLGMFIGIVTPILFGYLLHIDIYLGKYSDGLVIWGVGLGILLMVSYLLYRRKSKKVAI